MISIWSSKMKIELYNVSVTMAVPRATRGSRLLNMQAGVTMLLTIAALRATPLRIILSATRYLNEHAPRAATRDEAHAIIHAARRAASRWPGRAACLETSLTATWVAAFTGRAVTWCHGFRTQPYEFHAWIEVDGRPVAEPSTTGVLAKTLTISPTPRMESR
ncbi:lasso peptide biosynthesis B2 protein [Myceligenerans salitolerans]|uniref:Lasso peptide biosynthesis B2 protein n=1 Tax=Myceligenerans salitolerans TaxID=1230528 RepID=A0ABS3IDF1_9MICO|nr:lasso peptide biosynthesis B2 protein [Myceligenerans salitolerans]MBO0611065.1 lasso peptide biosynthesis B2 protein [Myceligenerans salitolerans]